MKTVHLLVTGKVQGVGFRWFVRQKARELRLSGWVMNRRDGSVELAASGEDGAIDLLEKAVRAGPNGASVSGVETMGDDIGKLTTPFEIRRGQLE